MSSIAIAGSGGGAASGLPKATANITVYVATTGSDSNPGTIGSPFATVQFALSYVGGFDYVNLYTPTINVAAGTYTLTAQLVAPSLVNCPGQGTVAGASSTTTILFDQNGVGVATGSGAGCQWVWKDLESDSKFFHWTASNTALFQFAHAINIADRTGSVGAVFIFQSNNAGGVKMLNITLNINTNFFAAYSTNAGHATIDLGGGGAIVFPASALTGGTWLVAINVQQPNFFFMNSLTITNGGSFTGAQANIGGSGDTIVETANGKLGDLPGTAGGNVVDNSCRIVNVNNGIDVGAYTVQGAGPPLNAGVAIALSPDPVYVMYKDGTNGPRSFATTDTDGVVYTRQIGNWINVQTSSYTLKLQDQEGIVEMNLAGANNLTVPANATVAFPLGTKISAVQAGAGATTVVAAVGVTVHNVGVIGGQWKSALLYKRATNEWVQLNGAF